MPPFYDQGNPHHAVTWFKDTPAGRGIYEQMTFYRAMARKYGVPLFCSRCRELPGKVVYEDEYQIAVVDPDPRLRVVTTPLEDQEGAGK